MKNVILQAFGCACFFAVTGGVANTQTVGLRVNIPFDFNVAENVLPAGHYLILAPRGDKLELRGTTGSAVFAITNQVSGKRPEGPGAVIFHCYKDRCFLAQFWTALTDTGQELLQCHLEKQLATKEKVSMMTLRATPYEQKIQSEKLSSGRPAVSVTLKQSA